MGDPAKITPLITCPLPTLPISLFPGPKLFPGSLEKLHLSREAPGRAQATSEQPPPLPPKMCRSVSVTSLRPTLRQPFQEGPSGRSLSQEDLLMESSADMVSHSSSEHGGAYRYLLLGPVLGTMVNRTDRISTLKGFPGGEKHINK